MPPHRRKWILWGALVLAVALVVAPALLTGPDRQQGEATAVRADDLSERALANLATLTDVKLAGTVYTDSGVPLHADIVALAGGDTTATVTDPAGGTAQYLVTADTAAIKADRTWWLNTAPAYARSLAGKWAKADDSMGFPVEMLRGLVGKQLAATITKDTGTQSWSAQPVTYTGGVPALALSTSDGAWTLYVAATGEPAVLGVGGPLAATPPRLRGVGQQASFPYTTLSTTAADDPCKETTNKEIQQARPQAVAAPPPPELPSANHGPDVTVQVVQTGVCLNTSQCDTPVRAYNSGDRTAKGTVTVTSTSGGGGTQSVTVPAGGTKTLHFKVNNPASSCTQTCQRTYKVQATYLATASGKDVDAARRLQRNGIDPNLPDPQNPVLTGQDAVDLLNRLLKVLPSAAGLGRQSDAGQQAIDLAETFLKNHEVSVVKDLLASPALHRSSNKANDPVLALVKAAESAAPGDDKAALVRTLYLLHDLAEQDGQATNSLVLDDGMLADTQHKRVYAVTALAGSTPYDKRRDQGKKIKAAAAKRSFVDKLGRTADTLAGYTTHPDYTRVLFCYVDDTVPTLSSLSKTEMIDYLVHGDPPPKPGAGVPPSPPGPAPRTVLADPAGKPKIGGLVLSTEQSRFAEVSKEFGGTYRFDEGGIRMLTAALGADQPPTAPPAAKDLHWDEVNRQHRLNGDAPDASDARLSTPEVSGGHLGGTGHPGKSEYPLSWTEKDIVEAEKQVMVPANLQNGGPTRIPNAYGVPEWGYTWTGPATITTSAGPVTVTMTVIVFADGSGRTSFPLGDKNPANGKPPTDPTVVYTNPPAPVKVPPGLARVTTVPRYDRATNQWTYQGVDAGGATVKVTTDDKGKPIAPPSVVTPTTRCT